MGHSPRHRTRASHSGVRLRNKTYGEGPARDNRNHLFHGLSSADCPLHAAARGPTPQAAGSEFYPLEWTSNGPGSNHQWIVSLVGQGHLTIMRHCRIIKTSAHLRHQNLRARRSQAHVGSGASENGGGNCFRSRQSTVAPGNGRYSQVALDRIGAGKARWNPDDLLPSRRTGGNIHADSLCEGRP